MQKKTLKHADTNMFFIIMSLAWPTMLEQLMQTAVQYIDTAMVGSLGTQATAAVGATTTVNWLLSSSISALSIGFLAFIAKSLGAGDKELAKQILDRMVNNPTKDDLFLISGVSNLRMEEDEGWWNDGCD